MNKIKSFFSKVYNIAKESNKTARILSFCIGFCFNFLGIIFVAVWKLIFSKDEVKNKYCIRLSILGFITKVIVCSKIFSLLVFSNLFTNDNFSDTNKNIKHRYHKPVHISVFNDFDKEFGRMHRRMNRMFEEQQRIFDEMFNDSIEEQQMIEREFDKLEKSNPQDVKVKKEVKNENGFETTTIEKTSPNAYSQQTTIKYVGGNDKQKQENFNNKQDIKKLQPVKTNNKKHNQKSGKISKKKNQK